MDASSHMAVSHKGKGKLGENVVAVDHTDGLEHPLVKGPLESLVSHPGAAEGDDLNVLMRETVLQVHRAQDGQSSAKGVPADADVNQLLRNLAVDSLSDLRAFIDPQKAFMNPDFCILVIIGDGLFPEGKIRLPVLGGIGASEADREASFLFSQIALDPGRAVVDDNEFLPRLTGLDIPIGEGGKLQGVAYIFSIHGIHLPLVYESVME